MTSRIDVDRIEPTTGERLLTVVLAVFISIGLVWSYGQLGHVRPEHAPRAAITRLSPADRAALDRDDLLGVQAERAATAVRVPHARLVDRREAYRTALDAGRDDPQLRSAYRAAQAELARVQRIARESRTRARAAGAAATAARTHLATAQDAADREATDDERTHDLVVAALRVVYALALLAGSLWLLTALRRRRSRWIVVGHASVGAAAVLALVTAGDYLSGLITPADLGPLALSLIGIALTLLAIAALHRYLARRLPGRRVRRGDCPFCGWPGRGGHCEGCGREILAACARCSAPRRVGAAHCAACGET